MAIDVDEMIEQGMSADEIRHIRDKLAPLCGYQRVGDCIEKPKRNKYGAQRTEYNGVRYDSKAEAQYAEKLDRDPQVLWVLRQVPIPLGPDVSTRVDFLVGHEHGYVQAHEVKGAETREFKRVRKLWPKYGPFWLRVIKGDKIEIIRGK